MFTHLFTIITVMSWTQPYKQSVFHCTLIKLVLIESATTSMSKNTMDSVEEF